MREMSLALLLMLSHLYLVSGDCFNEPPNNSSYDNCALCYQTFANALIDTADNKYQLSRAFFPTNSAPPVQVEVKWREIFKDGDPTTLYWVAGGFFAFQPVDVFLYRSLFFSPPSFRKSSVTLLLPSECFSASQDVEYQVESDNTTINIEFFVFATQRLMGYAVSQEAIPDIDSSYVGIAVRKTRDNANYVLDHSGNIITAAYGLPFFIFVVIILAAFVGIWNVSLDETVLSIKESFPYQANIIAAFLLCVIFVCYTAVLDIESCIVDVSEKDLPSYYTHNRNFLGVTITCMILYLLCFVMGVYWFCLEMLILVCPLFFKTAYNQEMARSMNEDDDDEEKKLSYVLKKGEVELETMFLRWNSARTKRISLSCVLILGSGILSVVAHFPSILMAWATDAFYASRIALFYGIIIFCYFSAFHYTYIITSKALSNDGELKLNKCLCFVLPASLGASFIAVTATVLIIAVYVISVPVNNSIETATEGVTSIYNGAVVLIGGLIAYRIGWQYIGHSFSISDAVENALANMKTPPLGIDKKDWDNATEEKKLTEVVRVIAESETVQNLLKNPTQVPQNSLP